MFHRLFCCVVIVGALTASPAWAVFDFGDINTWYGNGANQAALVIDFNDGNSPTSLVWGYRFDGSPTAEDMFNDIITANTALFAKIDSATQYGTALFGIGYDVDGDGFGLDDGSIIGADGFIDTNTESDTTENDNADGASATDADDHYEEGWFTDGFWVHWEATSSPYNGGAWASGFGLAYQTLTDGAWTGMYFDPAFGFATAPAEPVSPGSVPEPAGLFALAIGGLMFVRRRA